MKRMPKARRTRTVNATISNLLHNKAVTNSEYKTLYCRCRHVSGKVFHQYGIGSIIYNQNVQEDVIEDITTMALVKAIKGYRPNKKAHFLTYYYNKARSLARVHAGKCYRRHNLLNASSLDAYLDNEDRDD